MPSTKPLNLNLNGLIYTSANYKIVLIINGTPYPILTATKLSTKINKEEEMIHAIGQETAIGAKTNAKTLKGNIELQAGELYLILKTQELTDATDIQGAQLALATLDLNVHQTFSGVSFTSQSLDIAAKAKQTLIPCDFIATTNS